MAKKIFFAFAALAVFAFASASFAQDAVKTVDADQVNADAQVDEVAQDETFDEGGCDGCKKPCACKAGECKCGWKCVVVRGCFGCIKYRMVRVCDCDDCKCSCCAPVCCKPCCCKVVRCCAPVCCAPCCCY